MVLQEVQIVVLGSFMTDVVSYVSNLPRIGETLCGHKLAICCGGKGANQAVTAARLGAATAIIGKLGNDSFGKSYLDALKKENILTDFIGLTSEALTGLAQIIVEDSGQNSIVIVPGANNYFTTEDVMNSRDTFTKAKIMLSVLEIPRETVLSGLKLANELGVFTILNAAPAVEDLEKDFYTLSDIFCVNETEAEMLIKQPVTNHDEALSAAHRLMEKGCKKHVLITLGKNGALLLSRDDNNSFLEPVFVKAPGVKAIDTTGAGDCFLGALAYFLAYYPDWPLSKTVTNSCRVASLSVQRAGTQTSFPYKNELENDLFV
ncbi:ribokinase-like [Daphnia pulicaria]|uniref:ribokinase-like n=1 Tax=Daphnia pulicaria TaxID=35523 RepID=UPI001EE9C2FD|nr:ribokinase-like [Daphnia pulicaria]